MPMTSGRRSGEHRAIRPDKLQPPIERGTADPRVTHAPPFVVAYGFDADTLAPTLNWASEGMRTVLGYGSSALGPGWLIDAVHPDDMVMVVARHRDALRGACELVEARFLAADGSVRHLRGELRPADPDAPERGGIAHWTDVSAEQAARDALSRREEELWRARRLAVVGELAGGIAHDCSNLLTAIRAYSDLLKAELGETRHRDDLDAIARSADNAAALVRQLLTLGRAGGGQPRLLSMDDLVAGFERVLLRLLGGGCTLRVDIGQSGFVHADPGMIEHVLLNLLISAREAMPNGGTIIIATDRITLDEPVEYELGQVPSGVYAVVRFTHDGDVAVSAAPITARGNDEIEGIGVATAAAMVRKAGGHLLPGQNGATTELQLLFPSCVVSSEPGRASAPRRPRRPQPPRDGGPAGGSAA